MQTTFNNESGAGDDELGAQGINILPSEDSDDAGEEQQTGINSGTKNKPDSKDNPKVSGPGRQHNDDKKSKVPEDDEEAEQPEED